MTKDEMNAKLAEANEKLRQFFRMKRKDEISDREGVVLVVDDMSEQADVLRSMIKMRGLQNDVVSVTTLEESKNFVSSNDGENIKVAVVDLHLKREDGSDNDDGIVFLDWMSKEYPHIPYVVITGYSEKLDDLRDSFPGVDVFVKGHHDADDFADSIGLCSVEDRFGKRMLPSDDKLKIS